MATAAGAGPYAGQQGQGQRRQGGQRRRRRRGRGRQPTRPDDQVSELSRSLNEMRVPHPNVSRQEIGVAAPSGVSGSGSSQHLPEAEAESDDEDCLIDSLPEDSHCPICLSLPRDPQLTKCCGHHFCATCIGRVKSARQPCPLCKRGNLVIMHDQSFMRRINQLRAKCPKQRLCTWIGEYGSRRTHTCIRSSTDHLPRSSSPQQPMQPEFDELEEMAHLSHCYIPISDRVDDSDHFYAQIIELLLVIAAQCPDLHVCVMSTHDPSLLVTLGAIGGALAGGVGGARSMFAGAVLGGVAGLATAHLTAADIKPATTVLLEFRQKKELAAIAFAVADQLGLDLNYHVLTGKVVLRSPERGKEFLIAILRTLDFHVIVKSGV